MAIQSNKVSIFLTSSLNSIEEYSSIHFLYFLIPVNVNDVTGDDNENDSGPSTEEGVGFDVEADLPIEIDSTLDADAVVEDDVEIVVVDVVDKEAFFPISRKFCPSSISASDDFSNGGVKDDKNVELD